MPLRTTAFAAAEARGWKMTELARRSGLPLRTLYDLKNEVRFAGPRSIGGLMRAFPDLSYERLFVPVNSAIAPTPETIAEGVAA